MFTPSTIRSWVALLAATSTFLACDAPTGNTSTSLRSGDGSATAIQCPTSVPASASGVVSPLGGSITAIPTATSILLPLGAVLAPTQISVSVPASQYVQVDIRANSLEHFTFELPVTVIIDYSRCTRSDLDRAELSVYVFDPLTRTLTDKMVSLDDKLSRRITFTTGHLTSYVVAE